MGLFSKLRMKEPVRGTAQVVSATAHRGDSSWQDIRMTLTVQAEGVPPEAVVHRCICRADRWPSPGDVLPVTLDARKPKRLKVEWDEVESARDRAWTMATALAAGAAASPPAYGGDGGADRIAQLERLAKLRESGALTDAEFEAEKARILGGG